MIEIKNFTKYYGEKCVFENFSLNIKKGHITVILGESGSGKTTLINALRTLTDYSGEILGLDGKISSVFQKDNLIPNLTVEKNLLLVNKNAPVKELLDAVGLNGVEKDYIKSLSAGMARRVAIARALGYSAPTLIMDEPFINIDLANKLSIIEYIKSRHSKNGDTVIVVTHDIKEAVLMADRIVLLKDGKIVFDKENFGEQTEKEIFDILSTK